MEGHAVKAPRIVLLAALVATLPLSAPGPASASCPMIMQTLGAWFEQADAVFVGRVLEVSDVPVSPPPGESPDTRFAEYSTRFHVDELFKGALGEQVTVLAENTWHDCIVEFDVGEQYIVFAFRRSSRLASASDDPKVSGDALRSVLSSPTARVAARADVLAYLRLHAETGRAPRLVGVVYDRTPPSLEATYYRTQIGWYGVTTRSGITVNLVGGGENLTTTSDANGAFVFADVPEGDYSIRLALPEGCRLLEQYEGAPYAPVRDRSAPDRIEIKEGETVARYFTVSSSTEVSGRAVSPSGKPLSWCYAHMVLASELSTFKPELGTGNERAFVDEAGKFDFDVVPPGEYVLVFNTGREDIFDERGPTYFHPGVTDPSKATRFHISDGKRIDLGDVKAPAVAGVRKFDVSVVNETGEGQHADLRCLVGTANTETSFATDDNGRLRLYLRPGLRCRIEVVSPVDGQRTLASAEIGEVGPIAPVKMVVTLPPTDQNDDDEP